MSLLCSCPLEKADNVFESMFLKSTAQHSIGSYSRDFGIVKLERSVDKCNCGGREKVCTKAAAEEGERQHVQLVLA